MGRDFDPLNLMGGGKTSNRLLAKITRAVLIPLCVILIFCSSLLLNYNANVKAMPASIGELWSDSNKCFDGETLSELLELISGKTDATYDDVNNLISGSKTALTAADIRTNAGGNITVTFGGIDWTVTYLTRTRNKASSFNGQVSSTNGDLIVTLWQADTDGTTHMFTDGWRGSSANYSWATPAHMYGSSYLRSVVLNAGGVYSAYNGTVAAVSSASQLTTPTATKDANNKYAAFTMTQSELQTAGSSLVSLTDYIVSPRNVAYQETLCSMGITTVSTNYAGAGYGVPSKTTSNGRESTYRAKAHYADWADDYIWIPAIEEMGDKSPWRVDNEQRTTSQRYWSRTMRSDDATSFAVGNAVFCSGGPTNANWGDNLVSNPQAARPALHLNLTKAAAAGLTIPTQPAGTEYTYNGLEQTIDLSSFLNFDVNKMYVADIARKADGATGTVAPSIDTSESDPTKRTKVKFTDAGIYQVTLKAKTDTINDQLNSQLFWYGNEDSDDPTKTIVEIKLKKRQIAVPTFNATTGEKTYTGSKQIFSIADYPNQNIPASATEAYPRTALETTVKRTVNGASASYTNDFSYNTADNPKGMEIGATEAGLYSLTFKIKDAVNYEWAGATDDTADKTASFTIKPKQLSITISTTSADNALSWTAEQETSSATFTFGGVVSGDSVGIKLKLSKENDSAFSGAEAAASLAADGSGNYVAVINKSIFGGKYSAGSYPITPVIEGSQADNANYSFSDALTGWNKKLVIEASSAGLPSYDNNWRYTKDGGTPAALPTNKKFAYEFNAVTNSGVVYAIELDTTGFAAAHIDIDKSKYDNGYADASASAAGKYTTKVALKTTDSNYVFTLPDGTKSQTMDIELSWEIEKGTIDLSGAVWKYTDANGVTTAYDETKGVPWTGQNYTLTLTGLPAGVTINAANYTGNKGKYIGEYTAKPTTMSYDSVNYNTVATPELKWKIVAAEIKIDNTTWVTDQHTSGTGVLYLPHINSPYDGKGILYKYYDLGAEDDRHAPVELTNGVAGIVSDPSKIHYYYVEAYLSPDTSIDGSTAWDKALVFNDTTNPENGPNTMAFQTGNNLTPVSVTLSGNPAVYDGESHGVIGKDILVRVGSNNFDNTKYEVKYYKWDDTASDNKGAPLGGDGLTAPVDTGDYLIEVTLTGGADSDYFLSTKTLKLTIEPFKFDMSQVRWGYIDANGNEQIYNPSVPIYYELELDQDGNPIPVNPSDPNGVKKAKEHVLQLVGLPKGDPNGDDAAKLLAKMFAESGLENLISYSQDYKASAVTPDGAYLKARYSLNAAGLGNNFAIGTMPDSTLELPEEQNWRIESRKIDKPKDNSSQTFDGHGYNLLELAGLDSNGLGVYYTLDNFGYINDDNELVPLDPKDVKNIVNAGRYRLTFNLIDNVNVKWNANGVPKITPQSCNIVIQKLKLTLTEWEDLTGDNDNPFRPNFAEGTIDSTLYTNVITDSTGKELSDDEWPTRWNETLTQTIRPSAGNENNIIIEFAQEVPQSVTFKLGDDPWGTPATPVKKPEFTGEVNADGGKESVYTGSPQSFLPSGLQELFDINRVQLFAVDEEGNETQLTDLSYFTQTNAGKYKVVVRLKGNFKWQDTDDKADVEFNFEIKKAPLTPVWKTDSETGNPVASMPAGFEGLGNVFEYHYYDSDGNEVSEKDLKGDTEYRIGVSVKKEYKDNFDLQNADGSVPQNGVVLAEDLYKHPNSGFMGFVSKSFMGLPMWLWILLIILALFLLILFIVLIAKKRKKNKEDKETKQEKKAEKERLEAEKREREEEKRRLQEEREEEKRRREEEREEEKRRREEEREEEKRRREEEREEEKRRREEQREEERRRMEDERRRREELAAASALNMGVGMGGMAGMQGMNGMQNGINNMPQGMNGMQQNGMQGMGQTQMSMPQPAPSPQYQQPAQYAQSPYGQMNVPPQPPAPQYAPPAPPTIVKAPADSGVYDSLRAYEERLHMLEKELEKKRIENIRNAEHARARQEFEQMQEQRRREEELQRLRELQHERVRREEEEMRYRERYDSAREMQRARREMEDERLRMLEEQILKKETENRILEARLRDSYDIPPYPKK